MRAIHLKTEHMVNPVGIDSSRPVLSWNCCEGIRQTAYEILASQDGEEVWHTGKVPSSQMSAIYGKETAARQAITWQVRLWDEQDIPGPWSEATFETGLTDGSWKALWIDPELPHEEAQRQPSSVLRKRFMAPETKRARLYITCHGLYEARLNGKRVGDFVLAPGADDYRVRLQYQTYDVTELLKPGENELSVTLGDGWYRGNNGVDGLYNYYGSDLALLCQLEAGGKVILCSDGSWEASQSGPIRLNDMEKGETYDARTETITDWHGVTVKDYGYDKMVCSNSFSICSPTSTRRAAFVVIFL